MIFIIFIFHRFWGSSLSHIYPNPFLKYLCHCLWSLFPEFIIISECWGDIGGKEAREYNMI